MFINKKHWGSVEFLNNNQNNEEEIIIEKL